jgi:hypothetical protein
MKSRQSNLPAIAAAKAGFAALLRGSARILVQRFGGSNHICRHSGAPPLAGPRNDEPIDVIGFTASMY